MTGDRKISIQGRHAGSLDVTDFVGHFSPKRLLFLFCPWLEARALFFLVILIYNVYVNVSHALSWFSVAAQSCFSQEKSLPEFPPFARLFF